MSSIRSIFVIALLSSSAALAHHPMDGQPLETFGHGLLSGLAHPVFGYDHLFFIVAAAVLCVYAGVRWSGPVLLLIGVVSGLLLAINGAALPFGELIMALSLVLLAVPGMMGKRIHREWLAGVLLVLGVLHGLMYGQVLQEQESLIPVVLAGYLSGLLVVHYLIVLGVVFWLFKGLSGISSTMVAGSQALLKPQLSCAIGTGVGLTLVLQQLI